MFTASKDKPAIGINDPLIWGLLFCAVVVALGAFIWMRDQTMLPVGGFGGRGTDRGFPVQAGGFSLQSVKEDGGREGAAEFLVALYQRGVATPVTFEYHPIPERVKPVDWLDARVAEARGRRASIESRGGVVSAAREGHKAKKEGSFARLKGELPGDPVMLIWTQQIRGQNCGFVVYAPSFPVADEFLTHFPRTVAEEAAGVEVGVDDPQLLDELPLP